MGRALAETYARDPKFYSGTFCVNCGRHFRLIAYDLISQSPTTGSLTIERHLVVDEFGQLTPSPPPSPSATETPTPAPTSASPT